MAAEGGRASSRWASFIGSLGGAGKGEAGHEQQIGFSDEVLAATIRAAVQEETKVLLYAMLMLAGMVASMAVFLVSFAARQMRSAGTPAERTPDTVTQQGRPSSRLSTRDASSASFFICHADAYLKKLRC